MIKLSRLIRLIIIGIVAFDTGLGMTFFCVLMQGHAPLYLASMVFVVWTCVGLIVIKESF